MKPQAESYENHRVDIIQHESAKQYLDGVLNGRTTIPLGKWKKELAMLSADHDGLYAEYAELRSEVQNAGNILRCVEQVLRAESQKKISREKGIEL